MTVSASRFLCFVLAGHDNAVNDFDDDHYVLELLGKGYKKGSTGVLIEASSDLPPKVPRVERPSVPSVPSASIVPDVPVFSSEARGRSRHSVGTGGSRGGSSSPKGRASCKTGENREDS